ncbi:MAG: UvrD-helicase domain-containing protein [Gemmataceae bacterium]
MPLTEQQHQAIHHRETSVVLSSGAGCGKTHVLTQLYLSHLERDGAEVSQIVAITFTERAARQMRDRIRRAILERLNEAPHEDQAFRWEEHLRALETAQISTIHAFCGNILRQHAVETGLDPRFDVLEDYLAVNFENEALSTCLQELLTAKTTTGEALRELILTFGWKATIEGIQHLLRTSTVDQQHWILGAADDLADQLEHYARTEFLPVYLQYLTAANPKIARCASLLKNHSCTGPKMATKVEQILDLLSRLGEIEDLSSAVETLKEAAKVTGTEKAKAWESEEIYEQVRDAFTDFRKELPERLRMFTDEFQTNEPNGEVQVSPRTEAVLMGQRFLRVTQEVASTYQQLKRRNSVVDFQDLLLLARDLLRDNLVVREKLQQRFRYLLIDELQDTDPIQMELISHLAGLGLTGGKVFTVGDHSQSIYRFRGADVHLFRQLRQQMSAEGRLGLTLNFRSQPAILGFTNALIGPTPQGGDDGFRGLEDYEPLEAFHPQINTGPCVEFLWSPRGEKDNVTQARVIEAEWIARRIANMVSSGEKLVVQRDGGRESLRAVVPGDVVLLFRAMTNVGLYEEALRRHGLNYYIVGGRAFFAQQEIYDLLNLLRALENPQDAVSLAGTLRSPFCCLSDETLFVLARHPDGLWAGLQDRDLYSTLPAGQKQRTERARKNLGRWREVKNRLPIARLLGLIFGDTGYDAGTQFEFLGDRKLANLWKMVDMARSFDRVGLFGLAEFIGRLNDLVRSQPREEQAATQPENANVVRLMSIHQAKGLEFPVVILPDLGATVGAPHFTATQWDPRLGCVVRPPKEDILPFSDFGWRLWEAHETIADWQEDLRTLYVGCTRAQDYLILSSAMSPDFTPQNPWMLILTQRFDLETGRSLVPGLSEDQIPQVRVTNYLNEPPNSVLPDETRAHIPDVPEVSVHSLVEGPQIVPSRLPSVIAQTQADVDEPLFLNQWDAEDGSDRSTWNHLQSDLEFSLAGQSEKEITAGRIVRHVLARWDFGNADHWRSLYEQVMSAAWVVSSTSQTQPEVESALRRFAESDLRQHLGTARQCHWELEYLMTPPDGNELFERVLPHVKGKIDYLWQDQEGDWHVLYFGWKVPTQKKRRKGHLKFPEMTHAMRAVELHMGVLPVDCQIYYLAEGTVVNGAAK